MQRTEGTAGVKLIECVSPARNKWRVRWDVHEKEDGQADYMEAEFDHKPTAEEIKAAVIGWYNEQTDQTILSGFEYEGSMVWLSAENQFNYKAAYDLAVQTDGETLPVKFKFGRDHERFDVAWEGTAKGMTAAELYALFTEHANEVSVFITIKQNKPVWIRKDGVITGRHHYRYSRIEFEYQGKNMVGLGDFSLPGYIVDEPEVQEWLNHYDADDIALQQNAAAEAKAKAVAAKEAAKNDTVYAKDAYMPEFTKMSIPRIIRDNTFGAVALIDSGMFRYRGSVVRMSPYAIMTTEMTQKLFDQTMLRQQDSTKRIKDRSTFKNPSKPVHNITWDDARAACKLLGGDLPTEAQWEFAGRADNNEGALWTIDETADVGDYAVYRDNSYKMGKNSQAYGPQMAASKKPNAWGIYDMSGNVAEWTRDKYFMFSFWVESSNPTGAMMGYSKVYKGGSWKDGEAALNLTKSDDEDPRYWSDAIGFRCVFPRKLFEGR